MEIIEPLKIEDKDNHTIIFNRNIYEEDGEETLLKYNLYLHFNMESNPKTVYIEDATNGHIYVGEIGRADAIRADKKLEKKIAGELDWEE